MIRIFILIQAITLLLAFAGLYLIWKIYDAKKGADITTIRARAFLDESFLQDSWILLLIVCFFFMINVLIEFIEILKYFLEKPYILSELSARGSELTETLLEEASELGILISILILIYKWYRMIRPPKLMRE